MDIGLQPSTLEQILRILASYPQVESAILYGSRAKGNYRPGSDIDLTLKGNHLPSHLAYDIINDLEETYLPYTFDISVYDQISNPDLIDHINRVGREIYRNTANESMEGVASLSTPTIEPDHQDPDETKSKPQPVVFRGNGLTPEFQGASERQIRKAASRELEGDASSEPTSNKTSTHQGSDGAAPSNEKAI